MIEQIRARYIGRFLETARLRIARGQQLLAARELAGLASELHRLAGDAAMLELGALADVARAGEDTVRALVNVQDDAGLATCAGAVDRVVRELDRLATHPERS